MRSLEVQFINQNYRKDFTANTAIQYLECLPLITKIDESTVY